MDTASRIAIVDYGMGNLHSVRKAFEACGGEAAIARGPDEVARAEALVVPGVGSFGDCVENLARAGLKDAIAACIGSGRPYLGICLGLQILFSSSEEAPGTPGLGIIPGKVRKFAGSLKVPHMGWNRVRVVREHPVLAGLPVENELYFVHSYYPEPAAPAQALTVTEHGVEFTSSFAHENLIAMQFHAEKSGPFGLGLLERFASWRP